MSSWEGPRFHFGQLDGWAWQRLHVVTLIAILFVFFSNETSSVSLGIWNSGCISWPPRQMWLSSGCCLSLPLSWGSRHRTRIFLVHSKPRKRRPGLLCHFSRCSGYEPGSLPRLLSFSHPTRNPVSRTFRPSPLLSPWPSPPAALPQENPRGGSCYHLWPPSLFSAQQPKWFFLRVVRSHSSSTLSSVWLPILFRVKANVLTRDCRAVRDPVLVPVPLNCVFPFPPHSTPATLVCLLCSRAWHVFPCGVCTGRSLL